MTTRSALVSPPGIWAVIGCSMLPLTGCAQPPQIMDAWLSVDGVTLELALDTCNADLTTAVDFTASFVYVTVDAENDDRGSDCGDGLTLVLGEPLGERLLVDGRTGDIIVPKLREGG
jgi:hypothetical protein